LVAGTTGNAEERVDGVRINVADYLSRFIRCELDGVDITTTCFDASEEEGWADCFVFRDGQLVVVNDEPKQERRRGRVAFSLGPNATIGALAVYTARRDAECLHQ
jgi:hypothetical protein